MKILVIEDEISVASFIRKGLTEQSYLVDLAYDGQTGLQLVKQNEYDVIILDIILPEINGLKLCAFIREYTKSPILMLSALGTTNDIITGLDAGADDYLTKPFKFQELLARIRALMRRSNDLKLDTRFSVADLEIDYNTKLVRRSDKLIKLTAREFLLLQYFVKNYGILVSRSEIAEKVWDLSFDSGTNIVDVYINYLRNKLDKNYEVKLIHTVYGMGYIFKEDYNE